MTGDCYAILGVHPAAEDVVIGAAYRALMRHYHPDTNPDPNAQARVREITAAYALLRDPAKRAEYDARRSGGDDLWLRDEPPPPAPPPAMRSAGIAAALLALGLVGAVWAWPQPEPPVRGSTVQRAAAKPSEARPGAAPAIELQPEHERLAALQEQVAQPQLRLPVVAEAPEPAVADIDPPGEARMASAERQPRLPRPKRVANVSASSAPAEARSRASVAERPRSDRVATLARLSSGFFSQSMVHATAAKKVQLESMRDRFAAERGACRSDACVAGTYVRQMRETSAIMEGRAETE